MEHFFFIFYIIGFKNAWNYAETAKIHVIMQKTAKIGTWLTRFLILKSARLKLEDLIYPLQVTLVRGLEGDLSYVAFDLAFYIMNVISYLAYIASRIYNCIITGICSTSESILS